MKKITILLVFFISLSIEIKATVFTWSADSTGSSAWNVGTNWTPHGIPDSLDNVTIVATAFSPVLNQNRKVNKVTMTSGTLDLNNYTLTVKGTSNFNGGTIQNGYIYITALVTNFAGTHFIAVVNAYTGLFNLSGSTFELPVTLQDTGYNNSSGTGGCVFEDSLTIIHTGNYTMSLGTTNGNVYNGPVKVTNYSPNPVYLAYSDTSFFNESIELNSTNFGGIMFGLGGGVSYLANSKTISIGSMGFNKDHLYFQNFKQLGTTSQTITVTDTAKISLISCLFEGDLTITAPSILLKTSNFYGNTNIVRTGKFVGDSHGGNEYYGNVTISNNGISGRMRLATVLGDKYFGNATFNSNGLDLQIAYKGDNYFNGNVSFNNSSVVFNASTGKMIFAGSNNQVLNGSSTFQFKKVKFDKSANYVTTNSPIEVQDSIEFVNGKLITTSTSILTLKAGTKCVGASNSSFIAGPLIKVGNTSFEFPIGKNQSFRPVSISAPNSITAAFKAEYFDENQSLGTQLDSTINYTSQCNYWNINQTVGNSTVNLSFSYESKECETILELPIHVAVWKNSKWTDLGVSQMVGTNYIINSVSSFGSFVSANKIEVGQSCDMPIILNIDTIFNTSDHLFETFSEWYYFIPDSAENLLTINNHIDSTSKYSIIKSIELYTGVSCDSLSPIQIWNLDTLIGKMSFSEMINLIPEENYYLKIYRYNQNNDCYLCSSDSLKINICVQRLLNNVVSSFPCQNLVANPGFNTSNCLATTCLTNNNGANNVINDCCMNWHAGWGSPQAAGQGWNPYLSMWSTNASPVPTGEGAYQNLFSPIYKNVTYILNYDFRSTTTAPQLFRMHLKPSGGLPSSTTCYGGDPIPNLWSGAGAQLDFISSGFSSNWTHRSKCFNFNNFGGQNPNSLDQLILYPEHYQSTDGWVDIDNLSIQRLQYDFTQFEQLCFNETLTISPNCSIAGLTYSWDLSDPGLSCYTCESPSVTNTNTTGTIQTINYTVTLNFVGSSGSACSITQDIPITFLPEQPEFSISTTAACINNDICFTYIPCPGLSAVWDFGDGTLATQTTGTICHQFSTPGIYSVTLTVYGFGSNTYTTTSEIEIYPNCCAFDFDYTDGDITINPSGSTVTWTGLSVPPKTINGVVTIKSGKTLIIEDSEVRFGPKGKIIVEPSANLEIHNSELNAMIFSEGDCLNMWHGIEVWGTGSLSHSLANQPNHGRLLMDEYSGIYQAHNAIIVGKPNGAGYDLNYSGGIIKVYNSTFMNNGNHIKFAPFNFSNVSEVIDCGFYSNGNLHDFNYTVGNTYSYPNNQYPYYGPTNVLGRTANGIKAWGVKNVKIQGNVFDNIQTCIYNIDSKLRIYENTFENSYYGIYVANTSASVFNGNVISGNSFNDVNRQINILAGKYDYIGPYGSILRNEFNPGLGQYANNGYGIYLLGTSSFSILDNYFYNLDYGVAILNSLQSGGYIGYRSEGNVFTDCKYSTRGLSSNPALRIHCNQYVSTAPMYYTKSWAFSGTIGPQGMLSNDEKLSAGNRFISGPGLNDISSVSTLNYFRHNTSICDVNPQLQTIEFINSVPFNSSDPYTTCGGDPNDDGQRLVAIDSIGQITDSLTIIANDILIHLSEEETSQILEAIETYTSQNDLLEILRSSSPLSDEVLLFLNNSHNCLAADSLKSILLLNLSLSDDVYWDLILNNTVLDSTQKAFISYHQSDFSNNYSLTAINKQISYMNSYKEHLKSQLIMSFIADSSELDAVDFLNNSNSILDFQTLFSTYLLNNQLEEAQNLYENLTTVVEIDNDWLTVQGILLNLYLDNKTVFDLDSLQKSTVVAIAQLDQSSLATANARAILKLVYNEEYEDNLDYNYRTMAAIQSTNQGKIEEEILLYPNPADEKLLIYNYNKLGSTLNYEIINILGEVVAVGKIESKHTLVEVSTLQLSNGIYSFKFRDGGSMCVKKFMVIHN